MEPPWFTIQIDITHFWHWVLEQEGSNGVGNGTAEQRGEIIKVITNNKVLLKKLHEKLVLQMPPSINIYTHKEFIWSHP